MRKWSVVVTVLAIMVSSALPAQGARQPVPPLLDTMPNNNVYSCAGRHIQGGTSNGNERQAQSFTVTRGTTVSSVVLPLSVVGTAPAVIEVAIVGSKPYVPNEYDAQFGIFWDLVPDEARRFGSASASVSLQWQPCGSSEFITVRFSRTIRLKESGVYWVVLQNPAGSMSEFFWVASLTNGWKNTTQSEFVVDTNGARWLSNRPGDYLPNAIRILR